MVNIEGKQTNSNEQGLNEMATATKAPKLQAATIENFYLNPENVRKLENYDIATMIAKIAALGKVLVPAFALSPDTDGDYKGKRLLKDGNRRAKALQIIASRAKAQSEGKQEVLDASIATIEGVQPNSKSLVEAAKSFDYTAIDLTLPFIEVTKEQAEDEKEMLKLQLITGSSAKSLTPSEYAEGVLKLLAENDGDELRTATDLGNDKVWVQKIVRVYVGINKDDKMLAAIEEGRIDVDLADQIGAFARKAEMPIGSAVDEVLGAAGARGKMKATKKDLDSVKAAHNKPADPATGSTTGGTTGGTDGATGSTGGDDKPKTIRPRKDSADIISELIKFATQQLQNGFEGYDDEALSALATKADGLHNLMIKVEKATKEEAAKAAQAAQTPTPVNPPIAVAATPTTEPVAAVAPIAPVAVAETENKEPAIAQ